MKVVAPQRDRNPYQEILDAALAELGVETDYLIAGPGSHTAKLALLPFGLLRHRLAGARIFHLHWMFPFVTVWAQRTRSGRRLAWAWFVVCILTAKALGYRVVWTAHNVLPHTPVFVDDRAARRWLLAHADAVIALSAATVPALEALGACRPRVIPPGSAVDKYPVTVGRSEARDRLGLGLHERVLVFVGQIHPYKGVDHLLAASAGLPNAVHLRIMVIGRCADDAERRTLERLAARAGDRVLTRFEFVPDEEIQYYLVAADAAVLPFVGVSNSSSLMLAVSFGLPVVIPDLEELRDVPREVAVRYGTEPRGIQAALTRVAAMDPDLLASMSDKARAYAASFSWEAAARETHDLYSDLLSRRPPWPFN